MQLNQNLHTSPRKRALVVSGLVAVAFLAASCRLAPPPGTSDSPSGFVDQISAPFVVGGTTYGVRVVGWASDWNTTEPISVAFWVMQPNGRQHWFGPVLANRPRPDIDAAYRRGANFGFDSNVDLGSNAAGTYMVCAVAINVGPGEPTILGCRSVVTGTFPTT